MDSELFAIGYRLFVKRFALIFLLFLGISMLLSQSLDSAVAQVRKVTPIHNSQICSCFFNQPHLSKVRGISKTLAGGIILDNSSIPVVNYGVINGVYIGPQRNPVTISQKALYYYELFRKTLTTNASQSFINNVKWLTENAEAHGNYSILEYTFRYPPYNLTPPWQSAMAQGQALQALIDAYKVTDEKKYLDTAKMLLNSFFVEVKDGGVTYKSPSNGWWYEEYAEKGNKEPRVLNGMMYTLLGIYEYYNYTHEPEAKYLFDKGILALASSLPRYDNHGYSNYDAFGRPATINYHRIHVNLLGMLYNITKDEIFKAYHDRWESYHIPTPSSHNPITNQTVTGKPVSTGTNNGHVGLKFANKAYTISYQIVGGKVLSISTKTDDSILLVNISSTGNGKLTIELPRDVIDSKRQGNLDSSFEVFEDCQYTSGASEIANNTQTRILSIGFGNGVRQIEIVGTQTLTGSANIFKPNSIITALTTSLAPSVVTNQGNQLTITTGGKATTTMTNQGNQLTIFTPTNIPSKSTESQPLCTTKLLNSHFVP